MNTKRLLLGLGLAGVLGTGLALPGLAAADGGRHDGGRGDYRDHGRYQERDYRHWDNDRRYAAKHHWKDHDRREYRYYGPRYYPKRYYYPAPYYRDGIWIPGASLNLHLIFDD